MDECLNENGLPHATWGPLFSKEGITTPDDLQAFLGSYEKYAALSADATEEEEEALRRLLNIPLAENYNLDIEVGKQLTGAGLNVEHWLPIFKSKLGVKSPEALKHIGSESYSMLKPHVRQAWENKALRKLLGMDDEDTALRLQRDEQIERQQNRYEKSQKHLEDLKGHLRDGKSHHDMVVKETEDGICEALQIPAESWISHDTSLETLVRQLETCVEQFSGTLKTRKELSDVMVLQNASGGRALQGILVSSDLEVQLEDRDYMLRVPKEIQFYGARLDQYDSFEYFTSKHQESRFTRSVDKLGFSVTAAAKAGFMGFGIEGLASFSIITEEESTKQHHQQELYTSTIKYSFVPLASCCFKDNQLQLSDEALKALQEIENAVLSNSASTATTIQQQCEMFFKRFGSHVNKGHLHFGGIYWWKSCSQGFHKEDMEESKRIQSEAISVLTTLGYGVFRLSAEASVSHLKGKFQGKYDDTLISNTSMKVSKTGGPAEVSDLPLWKNGLVASNNTWSLIDRGNNVVPVWKIIEMNHKQNFKNPKKLSEQLCQAHGQMVQYYMACLHTKKVLHNEDALKVFVTMKSWNESMDLCECELHLMELVQLKCDLARRSMFPEIWPTTYLSQPPLQQYLKWVVNAIPQLGEERSKHIRQLMQQIIDPSDLHLVNSFPEKHSISKWVYQSDKEEPIVQVECRDFLGLKNYLNGALQLLYTAEVEGGAMGKARITATKTVACVVRHLRNHLQKAGQKYEDLFITTLLYPFRYDPNEELFGITLSTSDLKFLEQQLEEQSTKFFSIKDESLLKVQAYLFHLTYKLHNNVDVDASETQTKNHIEYLQKALRSNLKPEVVIALSHCQTESSYDWQLLSSELLFITDGVQLTQNEGTKSVSVILSEARDDSNSEVVNPNEVVMDDKLQQVLDVLHLTEYYPQKLTVKNAVLLQHQSVTEPHICILQRIMTFQYATRSYLPLEASTGLTSNEAFGSEPVDEIDKNEFEKESEDNESENETDTNEVEIESESSESEDESDQSQSEPHVHPMDGLLAVIYCSDNFLRRDLFTKLSTCQLAVPLLLPDPCTQTPMLPLWAMQSIVKEWKFKGTKEFRIVDYRAPTVSFIRFSQSHESATSKSRKLNEVLSDSQHHFFYHFDLDGGEKPRLLVDGLVEVCWFLPSGQRDPFSDSIAFTNLHGDARHHDKQIEFLTEISFMFCVLLSGQDFNEKGISVLKQLARKAKGGMVLMYSDPKVEGKLKELPKDILSRKKYHKLKLKDKNGATIKNEIRDQISKRLSSCHSQFLSIKDCANVARAIGIHIDVDGPECKKGYELAYTTLKSILPGSTTSFEGEMLDTLKKMLGDSNTKGKILKLQSMWQQWAKEDKEQHRLVNRGCRSVTEYTSQKEQSKLAIRKLQKSEGVRPTPLMESFLTNLVTHEVHDNSYFLEWLKIVFDDLSQKTLPKLRRQYQSNRRKINELKNSTGNDTADLVKLEHDQRMLSEKLDHGFIGIEHLFRELGQIYEALTTSQLDAQEELLYSRLPQLAAEFLVAGYPLELMDGDAAHVPVEWVMAVLNKLKEQLGDIKMFVLSVLGLQSSGKSTLLNTIFGLQFMVSAGRCTRGAFIQLLPLDDELKQEVECDYMLVVDTEGLRAPEIDPEQAQNHDNEIATFVIGLADVTIINIFGETTGDINDILQTAVHAFLRMEKRLNPRVQFVHQNVAAASESKVSVGAGQFLDKLDTMTKRAASEEKCEGKYTSFKDVIDFSEDTDIWYFPTLWQGDPPMAPVNPGYSEAAYKLRLGIIKILKSKGSQGSLSDFQIRLEDLWNAVLHENFIFSFKNTLEISAYNELDAKCCQWRWTLQQKMMEWEQKAENKIGSSNVADLGTLEIELTRDSQVHVDGISEDLEENLKKFFETNKQREIIAQWQSRTELRLQNELMDRQHQAKKHYKALISCRRALEKAEQIQENHRRTVLHYVKQLVLELGERTLSEDEQQAQFEEKWTGWLQELTNQSPLVFLEDDNVEAAIENCLNDLLRNKLVNKDLKASPFLKRPKQLTMKVTVSHLCSQRIYGLQLTVPASDVEVAQKKTNDFLENAKKYLQGLRRTGQNFKKAFVDELFRGLLQSINDCEKVDMNFVFRPQYLRDITFAVGGYAVHEFEAMKATFRMKNDPVEYLKRMKEPFLCTFKTQFSKYSQYKAAAINLCSLLAKPIEDTVRDSLAPMVVEDMKTNSKGFHTKKSLKARILCDLAEKGDFSEYTVYLKDISQSLQSWLMKYTVQHCSREVLKGSKSISRLAELAETELSKVVLFVTDTAQNLTDTTNLNCWIREFHTHISGKLSLDQNELKVFLDFGTLEDFDCKNFTAELIRQLDKLQQTLSANFHAPPAEQMKKWDQKPYDILYNNLAGCTEQCPFCKEQCEMSDKDHLSLCKHSVQLHRPECLGGTQWVYTTKMVLEICSAHVASDVKFCYHGNDWKPFKEYQTYHPGWSIVGDLSLKAETYWKWFVAKYSADIARHYEMKEVAIPEDWKALKWDRVKRDLEKLYHV